MLSESPVQAVLVENGGGLVKVVRVHIKVLLRLLQECLKRSLNNNRRRESVIEARRMRTVLESANRGCECG
jgi:hypothetical protein